jgi:Asp-tRNA(Asn)/Glu-tRNA(Gln) amidotransferase B subunit
VLEDMKNRFSSTSHFMAPYFNNCYNFVLNEMSKFCNEHTVPDQRLCKSGEMIPLPIDEYPIWFTNLEDFIVDLTWKKRDRKVMMKEVLPKLLNTFELYKDIIKDIDFSIKDSGEVEKIIEKVINDNPDIVCNYKKGKIGLINKLFGEVMKLSGGKIDVKEAMEILKIKLS